MDDEAHLDLLKEQYMGTVEFIQRLIEENKALALKLEEKTLDHESAAFACRTAQRELQRLQDRQARMRDNRYVMALIDGDGMIFKEDFICLRKSGGTRAGRLMLQELTSKLSQTPAAGAEIHIKVFANVPKLAGVLSTADRMYDPEAFREFGVGFTQTREHLYFIDVGDGKELVDSRIRAELVWHLENYNCQKVILGVSHDNGYARILSTILSDGNAHKVLLLEGTPAAAEVKKLSFQTARLPKVFESRKLKIPKSPLSTAKVTPPPPPLPPLVPLSSLTQPRSHSPSSRPVTPAAQSSPADQPTVVSTDLRAGLVRIKTLHPPPCNDHYLVGTCWRNVCNYSHEHTLSRPDLDALRWRTSRTRCDGGGKCKMPNCYRGHACTNVRDGKCTRYNCPFLPSEHPEMTLLEGKK